MVESESREKSSSAPTPRNCNPGGAWSMVKGPMKISKRGGCWWGGVRKRTTDDATVAIEGAKFDNLIESYSTIVPFY